MLAVAFWSPKGGAGKTTLSLNVAGDLTHRGFKVLLFDADPQGSCLTIAKKNELNFKVISGPPKKNKITNDIDFIIIDYPPRYESLPEVKRIVVPVNPSLIDLSATNSALKQLDNDSYNIIRVANNISRNLESRDIIEYLNTLQNYTPIIKHRTIYPRTLNSGKTVFQTNASTYEPRKEIRSLTETIFNELNE